MMSAVVLETTGVVSADFKQSEVGPIPLDWRVAPLREFLQCAPRYGVNAPAIPFDPSYPAYIRITDITEDGRFDPEARTSVKHSLASQYQLRCGDIVLARTGASTGKSYLYRPADGELVYAGFLIKICPDQSRLSSRFVRFWLQTPNYWSWVRANSMRSGQPGINAQQYASLPLPIPPTLAEQEAIADALEDADALIESLEQLIAKKRAVKQGAMQDLLSGRRRLPGFHEEWDYVPFGKIFEFLPTATNSRADLGPEGDAYYIHYGDIHTRFHTHLDFRVSAPPKIARDRCPAAAPLRNGDWIMADASEDFDGVGKSVEVRGLRPDDIAVAGLHTFLLRERTPTFVPGFKGHLGGAEYLRKQYMRVMTGMKVYGVSKTALRDLLLPVPPTDEQAALVEVLDDFNADVAALEIRLEKARQIKQGMMQELLTGRVRLV